MWHNQRRTHNEDFLCLFPGDVFSEVASSHLVFSSGTSSLVPLKKNWNWGGKVWLLVNNDAGWNLFFVLTIFPLTLEPCAVLSALRTRMIVSTAQWRDPLSYGNQLPWQYLPVTPFCFSSSVPGTCRHGQCLHVRGDIGSRLHSCLMSSLGCPLKVSSWVFVKQPGVNDWFWTNNIHESDERRQSVCVSKQ